MSDFRKLLKGTAYLAVGAQLSRVLNFGQVLLLTKYLGSSGYGAWSYVQALPMMLAVLTDLGLNSIMLREIASDRAREQSSLEKVFSLKLLLAPIYILAVIITAACSRLEPGVLPLIVIYSVSVVLGLCAETLIAVYRAHQRFEYEAKLSFVRDVSLCAILIATLLLRTELLWLVLATALHSAIFSGLLLMSYLKRQPVRLKVFSFSDYKTLLIAALPFAVYNLLNPLSMQIALVMLGALASLQSVGIYNAAFRLIVFLYFIPNALQRTLLPKLSSLFLSEPERYSATLQNALQLAIVTSLPLSIGLCLTANQAVHLLFSAEFRDSVGVLQILALSIPFYYLRVIMNAALYATGRERPSLIAFAVTTGLNAVANSLLIPMFGVNGAAIGTIVTEAVLCIAYLRLGWIKGSLARQKQFIGSVVLASVAMAATVIAIPESNLVLRVIAGAVVYCGVVSIIKFFMSQSPGIAVEAAAD
jgi:O-antigen/teichoic acid export membrane protein